jgi:hypothetical protein
MRTHAKDLHDWLPAEIRTAGWSTGAVPGRGALCQADGDGCTVLGFAETATGLAHQVAETLDAAWLQTTTRHPDAVLLFVPDLLAEVRAAFPEVEAAGARWVDVEALGSRRLE